MNFWFLTKKSLNSIPCHKIKQFLPPPTLKFISLSLPYILKRYLPSWVCTLLISSPYLFFHCGWLPVRKWINHRRKIELRMFVCVLFVIAWTRLRASFSKFVMAWYVCVCYGYKYFIACITLFIWAFHSHLYLTL